MTKLFDDIERTSLEPSKYAEPKYQYLNSSARIEAANVRNVLEQWFESYPNEHKHEFNGRFRSDNDYVH